MKDKRIWIVIGCILVIGTGVTHYTKYYVNSQGAAMMAEITAGQKTRRRRLPLPRLWDSRIQRQAERIQVWRRQAGQHPQRLRNAG